MTRVEIDLNVRVRGNWTFTGLEDADGPVEAGDLVRVYEPESGLEGPGRVEEVDLTRRLIFLSVDWSALSDLAAAPAMDISDLAAFGVRSTFTYKPGVAANTPSQPAVTVEAVSAVACPA